jgi:hypothetical protein
MLFRTECQSELERWLPLNFESNIEAFDSNEKKDQLWQFLLLTTLTLSPTKSEAGLSI